MTRSNRLLALVIILLAVVAAAALVRGERRCQAAGGQYVRSLFGMECVR